MSEKHWTDYANNPDDGRTIIECVEQIKSLQVTISENKKTLEEIFSIVAQRDPQILTHKQAGDAVEEICSEYFRGVCL